MGKEKKGLGGDGTPSDSPLGRSIIEARRILRTSRNYLKVKRWEAGLKQYELAFLLGCSAPYLSMVENNRVEATPEFKRKAAAFFELPVEELFPEED